MTNFLPKLFLLGIIFSLIVSSCKKDDEVLGSELISEDKLSVLVSDTSTLQAYSFLEDSLRTDETTYSVLGSFFDPVFGRTDASIYTQISSPSGSVSFTSTSILDSITLILRKHDFMGYTTTPRTIRIYELGESLVETNEYYHFNKEVSLLEEIGSYTYLPTLGDELDASTLTVKIPLDTAFGNALLNADLSDSSVISFKEFLKGILIEVDPVSSGGSLSSFNLLSSTTALNLYYRNDIADTASQVTIFPIDATCARYNHFNHNDYADAGSTFRQQVIDKDTILGDSLLYLQPLGGVKTIIRIPNIKNWHPDTTNRAIYKAELVLKVDADLNTIAGDLSVPDELLLLMKSTDTSLSELPDYDQDLTITGSPFDAVNNEYRFTLIQYVFNCFRYEDCNYDLILMPANRNRSMSRLILGGAGLSSDKLALEITYTPLNE